MFFFFCSYGGHRILHRLTPTLPTRPASFLERLAAVRADRIHDLLGGLGARTIGERDMRPGTSELFANDRTDAAASSRNDRDPALECLPHHASSPCICINSCDIPRVGSTVGERIVSIITISE